MMLKWKSTTLLRNNNSEQEQADTTTKMWEKEAKSSCAQCLTHPKNVAHLKITAMTKFIQAKEALASTQAKASPGLKIESWLWSLEAELQKANRKITDLESTRHCKCKHTFKFLHLLQQASTDQWGLTTPSIKLFTFYYAIQQFTINPTLTGQALQQFTINPTLSGQALGSYRFGVM